MREQTPVNQKDIEMSFSAQAECKRLGYIVTADQNGSFIVTTNDINNQSCTVDVQSGWVTIQPRSESSNSFAKSLQDDFTGLNFTQIRISRLAVEPAQPSPTVW